MKYRPGAKTSLKPLLFLRGGLRSRILGMIIKNYDHPNISTSFWMKKIEIFCLFKYFFSAKFFVK